MTELHPAAQERSLIGLLLRVRARSVWNLVVQTTAEAPIRVSVAGMLVIFIWLGLYSLFLLVFRQFDERTRLETTVAIPLVFNFFFVAMLAMLTFSNAIIAHGALFSRRESEYLLASPLCPTDLVTVKFLESLAFSSWSLILLGLPLMAAMADRTPNPLFHLVFIAFFLFFIPIPGALGLVLAWLSAQYFPRRLVRGGRRHRFAGDARADRDRLPFDQDGRGVRYVAADVSGPHELRRARPAAQPLDRPRH
jgi:hypothetical protein